MDLFVQQLTYGILIGMLYALTGLGITVQWRCMALLCFAYGEFCMLGAFLSTILVMDAGLPYIVAFLIAVLLVGLLGFILERIIYRPLRDSNYLNPLAAFVGVSIILQQISMYLWGAEGRTFPSPFGETPYIIGGVRFLPQYIFAAAACLLLMLLLRYLINNTKIGVAFRAISQDPETARLLGIPLGRMHGIVFALCAALGAAAGSFYGPMSIVIFNMGLMLFIKAFICCMIGGLGNVRATILGAILFGVIEQMSAAFISSLYRDAISFGILILMVMWKPDGLFGKKLVVKI